MIRGLASTDRPVVAHYTRRGGVLEFLDSAGGAAARRARHVVPRPLPAHQGRPLFVDLPPTASLDERAARLHALHDAVPPRLPRLLRASRDRRVTADPRVRPGDRARARPRDVELRRRSDIGPRRRRVLRERHQRDARRRVGVGVHPDLRRREVRGGVLGARGTQARRGPPPPPLAGRVALVTGSASGIGRAIAELAGRHGAAVVVADLDAEGATRSTAIWARNPRSRSRSM